VFRPKRACLWLAGEALVVGALLLTDWLLWQPGLTQENVRREARGAVGRARAGLMCPRHRLAFFGRAFRAPVTSACVSRGRRCSGRPTQRTPES
jgi:hypothetical protein